MQQWKLLSLQFPFLHKEVRQIYALEYRKRYGNALRILTVTLCLVHDYAGIRETYSTRSPRLE
jgi:hypothetical protein